MRERGEREKRESGRRGEREENGERGEINHEQTKEMMILIPIVAVKNGRYNQGNDVVS